MDGDGRRRWRPLAIDLNNLPPVDEDDVVMTPQTNYLTRNLRPRGVADSETMVFYPPGTEFSWFPSMRQRSRRLQTQEPVAVIIRDRGASFSVVESVAPPPSPPPSSFSCPICFEPLVNETATKCGHVFCQRCIGSAITDQLRCPICRLRLTHQDLIRVYLPPPPPQLPTFPCPICLRQVVDATATNCDHIFCEGAYNLQLLIDPNVQNVCYWSPIRTSSASASLKLTRWAGGEGGHLLLLLLLDTWRCIMGRYGGRAKKMF